MMHILEDVDVGGVGDQIWILSRSTTAWLRTFRRAWMMLFDQKQRSSRRTPSLAATAGGATSTSPRSSSDDRSNSLVIISTERAYLRILEFIRRLDVPLRTGEGEIHVLALQHADAVELAKTLTEIVTGAVAAGTGGGAPGKPGSTPLAISVGGQGERRQVDQLDRRDVEPARLREPSHCNRQAGPAAAPSVIEAVIMDLTIDRENQAGVAFHAGDILNNAVSTGPTTFRWLESIQDNSAPEPDRHFAQCVRIGYPLSRHRGDRKPPRNGHLDPRVRSADQRPGQHERCGHPVDAAHPRDRQHTRRNQRRTEHPAANELGGIGALPGAAGAAGGALGALGGFGGFGTTAPRQDIGTKVKIVPHLNDSDEVRLEGPRRSAT